MSLDEIRYRKATGLDKSEMTDGYLIYDRNTDRVHFLNPTAAIAFELCDGAHSVAEIADYIQDAFKLAESPLSAIETCLSSLHSEGLIEPCARS